MTYIDSNAALGAAINYAAGNLADRNTITITIEKGGYGIHLDSDPDFKPDNDNITDDILECVRRSNLTT